MMNAIDKLIKGHIDFRDGFYHENQEYLQELGHKGQSPKIAVVSCCDSRVDPAFITTSKPGDLFVIRNVANLVPPYVEKTSSWHGTSAALQFAVCNLEVEHIIVLGHASCGGIRSLFTAGGGTAEDKGFIGAWMRMVDKARKQVLADPLLTTQEQQISACEQRSIQISLDNLRGYPWIKERISQGRLELHGWFYSLNSGNLMQLNEEDSHFHDIYLRFPKGMQGVILRRAQRIQINASQLALNMQDGSERQSVTMLDISRLGACLVSEQPLGKIGDFFCIDMQHESTADAMTVPCTIRHINKASVGETEPAYYHGVEFSKLDVKVLDFITHFIQENVAKQRIDEC